jgi:thiamine-monophosphate kinase
MSLGEFDLIRHYFTRPSRDAGVVLGVGDDAAILAVPPGEQLLVSTDTLVGGRHFPDSTDPEAIGWKALAVNLSDLAAMGATPRWCVLALTVPTADMDFLASFAQGFHTLAQQAGIDLVGGDTARGPLSITITVMGTVPAGQALRRDGARAGDGIYVSGMTGDAGLGLALVDGTGPVLPNDLALQAWQRLDRPEPRLALGLALRGLASSAIDISDGLLQDLGHILERSDAGATLDVETLPFSPALRACNPGQALAWALAAGDDYELCFTVPPEREAEVPALAAQLGLALTRIGCVDTMPGLRCIRQGEPFAPPAAGFQHFRPTS